MGPQGLQRTLPLCLTYKGSNELTENLCYRTESRTTLEKSTSFSLLHFVEETSPVDGDTGKLELAKAEAKVEREV